MKRTLQILAVGVLMTFCACQQFTGNNKSKSEKISKITVAFSGAGCEGECPYQAVSIDSSLAVSYYGGGFAKRYGFYKGIVSKNTWERTQTRFNKFISVGIDTTKYQKTDHPYVEFYITNNFKRYGFKENTGRMSKGDLDMLYGFIELALQDKTLKKCDSINFETSIQF